MTSALLTTVQLKVHQRMMILLQRAGAVTVVTAVTALTAVTERETVIVAHGTTGAVLVRGVTAGPGVVEMVRAEDMTVEVLGTVIEIAGMTAAETGENAMVQSALQRI